jgi:hypothetical protein
MGQNFQGVRNLFQKYLIFLPILLAIFVLSTDINKPFVGHHDFMSVFEGMIARNFVEHGFWQLKFGGVTNLISSPNDNLSYSTHHPQFNPILIAISFSIFGVTEWAARLVPIIFSLIGVSSLFLITSKIWNLKIAIYASFFYIFNPMFIYFGKVPSLEVAIISLSLLAFYLYLKWIENKSRIYLYLFLSSIFIGGLIDWTMGYGVLGILLFSLITRNFKKHLLLAPIFFLLTVFILIIHNYILTSQILSDEILKTIKFRLFDSNVSFGGTEYSLFNYINQEISLIQAYFTRVMIFFSFIYLILDFRKHTLTQRAVIISILIFGSTHLVFFSRYVFIHDYLNFFLLPFFAITAALGLNLIVTILSKKINKVVVLGFIGLIFLLLIRERIDFTKALLRTNMNKAGLEMAQLLNSLQSKPREAIIISPRFASFYEIFINFYSDFPYSIGNERDLQGKEHNFKYIITLDQDIEDKTYYQSLIQKYRFERNKDITIIYTNEKN